MKLLATTALALAFIASPAFALRVTNLDTVPHTVALDGAGNVQQRMIQPGETEYFTGNSYGRLSLVTPPVPAEKKGKGKAKAVKKAPSEDNSMVHADGILSGIIGTQRSENIPADADSDFSIWPGGKLSLQSNHHRGAGNQF